eukprot:5632856-Alexandrium_andersonii.AAC.1
MPRRLPRAARPLPPLPQEAGLLLELAHLLRVRSTVRGPGCARRRGLGGPTVVRVASPQLWAQNPIGHARRRKLLRLLALLPGQRAQDGTSLLADGSM